MSKYNQREDFWLNYNLNNITIIKKIGEKVFNSKSNGKIYHYKSDVLLAKCICGYEYEILAKSFLSNKPNSCRMCATKNEENIGVTINNLLCIDSFHKRNNNGRSVIYLKVVCNDCNNITEIKADRFRIENLICNKCHPEKRKGKKRTPFEYFKLLGYGAKKRKLEFSITFKDILDIANKQKYKCILSGLDISFDNGSFSIDRINSSKGYIVDNIQCVHRDINFMKQNYSQEYFIDMCSKVAILNKKI